MYLHAFTSQFTRHDHGACVIDEEFPNVDISLHSQLPCQGDTGGDDEPVDFEITIDSDLARNSHVGCDMTRLGLYGTFESDVSRVCLPLIDFDGVKLAPVWNDLKFCG